MILQVNSHSRCRNFHRLKGLRVGPQLAPKAAWRSFHADSELRMLFLRTRAVFNRSFTFSSLNSAHAPIVGIGGTLIQPDPPFDGGGSQNSSTKIYYRARYLYSGQKTRMIDKRSISYRREGPVDRTGRQSLEGCPTKSVCLRSSPTRTLCSSYNFRLLAYIKATNLVQQQFQSQEITWKFGSVDVVIRRLETAGPLRQAWSLKP